MASVPPPYGPQDDPRVMLLAKLLRGENRANLTREEALRIGDTVLNRMQLAGYPSSEEEVLAQNRGEGKFQYSPMDPNDPNYKVLTEFGPQHHDWETYAGYAREILDPTRQRSNSTHYFSGKPPVWAGKLSDLAQVGSHKFGREKRRKKK